MTPSSPNGAPDPGWPDWRWYAFLFAGLACSILACVRAGRP